MFQTSDLNDLVDAGMSSLKADYRFPLALVRRNRKKRKKKCNYKPKFVLFCSVHFHNSPIKARTATVVHLHMSVCLGLSMWRSFKTAIYLIHCTIGHMRCGRSVNRCENIGLSNREQSFSLVSLSGSQKKMSSALQFHCSAAAEATSADEERPEYLNVAKQQQQKNTD